MTVSVTVGAAVVPPAPQPARTSAAVVTVAAARGLMGFVGVLSSGGVRACTANGRAPR